MDLEQILFLLFSLRACMQWHIHVPSPESVYGVILNNIHIIECDFVFIIFLNRNTKPMTSVFGSFC